jgi:predicted nucleic acid-binding Zn ribbon protein
MSERKQRRGEGSDRGGQPERLADALGRVLQTSGIADRVKQTEVINVWPELVGPEIAAVTRAISVSEDGTLFAVARSHAWMNELTFMEADLLTSINRVTGKRPIRRIRWALMR